MKNLKKVLSLGLALVMLLGMMTVASAAGATTKLADMDKVVNKNEVSLLVDLGVISGIKDGDQMLYKPENAIQRDAWAKMVYYVMEGVADETPYKNSSTLKDIENNWANGFISYLATAKIVSGDDLGNYNPLRSIRVNEAAKTLLTAAGWDASDRDYVGASWSGSVMSDANRFGLMNGIALTANDTLTRDAAAKMIVNALDLAVVKAHKNPLYVGTGVEKFVDRYDPMNETLGHQAFGLVKVTGVVDAIDNDGNITWRENLSTDCKDTVDKGDVVIAGDASMVGQSVIVYIKAAATFTGDANGKITLDSVGTVDSVISSAPILGGMTVLKTVTGGFADWDKAATKGDDAFICEVAKDEEGNDAAVYYVNGVKGVRPSAPVAGEVVEFCDTTGDGKADTIRVYNWKVAELTDEVKTTTKKDKTTVTVAGIDGLTDVAAANVTGYEGLKEGDVVLYYTAGASDTKTFVIEKLEGFTGAVASKNKTSGDLTIAGKAYSASALDGAKTDIFEAWTTSTDTTGYTWYTDKAGNICFYAAPAGAKVEEKIALVLDVNHVDGASTTVFGSGNAEVNQAHLLFTDGTTEVVNVAKIGTEDVTESLLTSVKGAVVKYSVNSSKLYTLTDAEAASVSGDVSAKIEFVTGKKADDATVFIVAKIIEKDGEGNAKSVKYDVFTGFKNLPSFSTTEAGQMLTDSDSGAATYVFLTTDAYAGDAPAGYVYITSLDYDEIAGQSYVEMAVVNADGKEETLKVNAELAANEAKTKIGFTTIAKVDENEVVTDWGTDAITATKAGETADLTLKGSVVTVNDVDYQYDKDTVIIVIDVDADGYVGVTVTTGATTVKANDGTLDIYLTGAPAKGDLLDLIYVVRTAAEDAE